jgi:hypothetical protein
MLLPKNLLDFFVIIIHQKQLLGVQLHHERVPVNYRATPLCQMFGLWYAFLSRKNRQKRITEELIKQAIKYAKDNGANYVEAYPVDPESPSYRFMGFKPIFDKVGFDFKHKAGQRRYVMAIST